MSYENLFKPIKIGKLTVKNRIVMTAMATSLSNPDGTANQDIVDYFKARARGGTGLIYTEFCRVDIDGPGSTSQLAVYNHSMATGLRKITEAVHRFDARIFLQIHHAGRMTKTDITGKQPIAPSPIPLPGDMTPHEMTVEEIQEMVAKFVDAAKTAKIAQFDGVEIHCAHGYLLNQFISPFSNKRTDEYGGTTEKRVRIVKEIMEGIKKACGPDFPMSVRISADDLVPDGMDLEEACKVAKLLENYGASILNVSAGGGQANHGVVAPSLFDQGWLVPLAEGVKKVVNIPVIAVSLIRDFDYADSLIADGKCDMVALARQHLADPNFVNKLRTGRTDEIRRCIVCMGCIDGLLRGRVECAINPTMGYESEFKTYNKNGNGRKVVVVGGGPAGCQAAFVLAKRGFKVTLFEKASRLGGQLNIAYLPPHKFRIEWLIEYFESNLPRVGVAVRLSTEATIEKIKAENPYAVIVATGGESLVPPMIKIENSKVCTANDIFTEKVRLDEGSKAVVVGSGMTGMETVHYLLDEKVKVTVAEMLPVIGTAPTVNMIYLKRWLAKFYDYEAFPSVKLISVVDNVLTFENLNTGETFTKEADCTVFASGVRSVNALGESVKAEFENAYVIGDAYGVGQIKDAIRHGFMTAWHLDDGWDVLDI